MVMVQSDTGIWRLAPNVKLSSYQQRDSPLHGTRHPIASGLSNFNDHGTAAISPTLARCACSLIGLKAVMCEHPEAAPQNEWNFEAVGSTSERSTIETSAHGSPLPVYRRVGPQEVDMRERVSWTGFTFCWQ